MRGVVGGLLGAVAGFAVGSVVYLLVNPALEAASGPVRELQGLLWNIVPLLTAGGLTAGVWLGSRRTG